jgi:glucosyl-dolichyl phosphate glucuronosyltransferase
MSRLSVSVIICAHTERRWDDTLAAVASVRSQSYPAKELIVVVDHNKSLYERLKAALPDATVAENREQQGLSGGKNTGIAMTSGQVVAFLDDDAIADANWLKFMVDSYNDPGVAGVGGLTLPKWDTQRPSWFPPEFDWVIGCTYAGMPAGRAPVRNLLGGNASFLRAVFDKVGGFKSGIGRAQGKRPLGCEETEFCIRLNQQMPGAVLLFDDRAMICTASVLSVHGSPTTAPAAMPRACRRRWLPGASAPMMASRPSATTPPGPYRVALPAGWPIPSAVTVPASAARVQSLPASPPPRQGTRSAR